LLTGGNGIEIWNIADSTRPVFRNVIPYAVNDFAIFDTLLYFASAGTFHSYSIADAASPYELGTCTDSGDVMAATGYVAVVREQSSFALSFVDVSDPSVPRRAGGYNTTCLGVDARGSICVASKWVNSKADEFWVDVIDISDPASPRFLGEADSVGGCDIHLSGSLAFASGFYVGYGFAVVDISDSTRPSVISRTMTPNDRFAVWADWASDRAYVADAMGMAVIDISDLNSPAYDTTLLAAHEASDVWLDQERAYVADGGAGLRILDVTNPAAPVDLGGIDTANIHAFDTHSAVGRDSFAFIDWLLAWPPLRSIDVTDPSRPGVAGGCAIFNPVEDMVLVDSLLHLAEDARFQVVNVARPRDPTLLGSCRLSGNVGDMDMVGDTAYVTSLYFTTIDVSEPDSPRVINEWNRLVYGIDVADTILYMAYQGLKTASIANPTMPYVLDSVYVDDYTKDVARVDTFAVLGGSIVRIYNVADPRDIRLVGTWTPPGMVQKLVYEPPYIYAACWAAGICVLEVAEPGIQESARLDVRQPLAVVPSVTVGPVRVVASDRPRSLMLYDALGKEVMGIAPGPDWSRAGSVLSVNLAGLPAGVYVLRGIVGGQATTSKVVKTRRR